LENLVELRNKYPKLLSIIVGFTLSDLTIDQWEKVREYTEKFDIEFMMQWYNQSSFYGNSVRDEEELRLAMIEAVKCQPRSITREKWLKLLVGKSIKYRCLAAQSFFVLKCDGQIAPCLSYWDDSLGNARDISISEIWRSDAANKVREKVSRCSGCLNSWGVTWSASALIYPSIAFYLRNPMAVIDRLRRRD
jgi:MoaA/NifB/PqqE/SkfB family radical SAM enzyme